MARFSDLPVEMVQRIADMADTPSILALRLANRETERRVFSTFAERCLSDLTIGGSQLSLELALDRLTTLSSSELPWFSTGRNLTFVSSDRYLGLQKNNHCTVQPHHIRALLLLLHGLESITLRNDSVAMPRVGDTWDGGVILDQKDPWLRQKYVKTANFDTCAALAIATTGMVFLHDLTLEGVTIESRALHRALQSKEGLSYLSIRHVDLQGGSFTSVLETIQGHLGGLLTRFIIDTVFDPDSGRYEYSVVLNDTLTQLAGGRRGREYAVKYEIERLDEDGDEMQEIWLWRTRGSMKGSHAVETALEIMLHGR